MKKSIETLIRQLSATQDGGLWMYESYKGKLDKISEGNAFVRPIPNMHSVAEIIWHLTTWRRATLEKLGVLKAPNEKRKAWETNESLQKMGWSVLLEAYQKCTKDLVEFLEGKEDDFLSEKYFDTDYKMEFDHQFLIEGVLHHDIYHLGQIGMVIKFLKEQN